MGKHPTGNRKYNLGHVWDRHREILRLASTGLSNLDIARELNITPQTVSNTMNSPIVQEKMNALRDGRDESAMDVSERIREIAPVAVEKIIETMRNSDLRLEYAAAKDLLDRAGFVAPTRMDIRKLDIHMTGEDIEKIKARQKEKGIIVEEARDESN